ncbi:MAG: Xaa-Pro peptidase family protein [Bacteroidia bacterium]|nr:Xaa-Pro peptidase family protein [Bacteroidia bacterium]
MTPKRKILRSPEIAGRLRGLRASLRERGCDALLVTKRTNVRYLSGFTGSNGWLLVKRHSALLVTDSRYEEQAGDEVREATLLIAGQERLSDALLRVGALKGAEALCFEAEDVSVALHGTLKKTFKGSALHPLTGIVESLREKKSPLELASLRNAVDVVETVLRDILSDLRPGVSEQSIAARISYRLREAGADGDAFDPIVLFGPRTSLVHGTPGPHRLKRGQPILMDIGCKVKGYCSDITRTFILGRASKRFRAAYDQLQRVQQAARDAVREGVAARTLDALTREGLAESGMDTYFGHALGHGLGLDVHETPVLSSRSERLLEAGQIVTIEPGVYFPGEFGIRIEDDVLVQREGSESITRFPRELMEL